MANRVKMLSLLGVVTLLGCRTPGSGRTQALMGKQAPDFSLSDLGGREVSLAGLRGKPVVVAFFGYG